MKHRIIPALLSGGAGTRLWPASTDSRPKQFHALGADRTLIQETALRVAGETDALSFAPPIVLANVRHADLVSAQLAEAGVEPSALVLEPVGRNTAATAAIAAALAAEIEPGALVLLLPADHLIADTTAFHAAIAAAAPYAKDHIVTFGIAPSRPEVGYGYIKRGDALGDGVFHVEAFKEKPAAAVAEQYLREGGYSWNAGMFFFAPEVMLAEFEASADIRDASVAALASAAREGVRIVLDEAAFARVRAAPVDTAVMEKTRRAAIAPCDIGWADVGSWDEIWRVSAKDAAGNVAVGETITLDANNNLLRSDGPRISVVGLDDLVVIASGGEVVIAPRARAQDVKKLLEEAKKR